MSRAARFPDSAARRGYALVALCLAFLLVQLDATAVNVAFEGFVVEPGARRRGRFDRGGLVLGSLALAALAGG
jgi:hypothetical protein